MPVAPRSHARVLIAPLACLLLAVTSVAAGAFVLPRLTSKPAESESMPSLSIAVYSGNSGPITASNVSSVEVDPTDPGPAQAKLAPFDEPPVAPRLPSEAGPHAISRTIDRDIEARLSAAKIPASPLSHRVATPEESRRC